MPQLIRTPEDIFRVERRDVYVLDFKQKSSHAIERTLKEMQSWFAHNMPDSPTEILAPSEHSGWIMGGPCTLRIAFTEKDLAAFCAGWERADGQSLDPRFQCCQLAYADWLEQYGQYVPTLERPSAPGVSVWIDTPLGILSHVLHDAQANAHPAHPKDLWFHACQQWPQLQHLDLDDLNFGKVVRYVPPTNWCLLWNAPFMSMSAFRGEERDALWRSVADWLRLPPETDIGSEF